jgi:hypothetical protein
MWLLWSGKTEIMGSSALRRAIKVLIPEYRSHFLRWNDDERDFQRIIPVDRTAIRQGWMAGLSSRRPLSRGIDYLIARRHARGI